MRIYISDGDVWQNTSEYTVVFRGSIISLSPLGETGDIWKNNIEQALSGNSADIWDVINYARGFVEKHNDTEVTFTWHSKGGAEAAATAATNKDAILFNPANANLENYGVSADNYTKMMTQFVVKNEILSNTVFQVGQ